MLTVALCHVFNHVLELVIMTIDLAVPMGVGMFCYLCSSSIQFSSGLYINSLVSKHCCFHYYSAIVLCGILHTGSEISLDTCQLCSSTRKMLDHRGQARASYLIHTLLWHSDHACIILAAGLVCHDSYTGMG